MAPLKQVANPTYYAPQPVRPQTVRKTQRKPVVRKAKPVAQAGAHTAALNDPTGWVAVAVVAAVAAGADRAAAAGAAKRPV